MIQIQGLLGCATERRYLLGILLSGRLGSRCRLTQMDCRDFSIRLAGC